MPKISLWRCRPNFVINLFACLCCLSISPAWAANAVSQLAIYPVTEGMPRSVDFTVKVRTPGQRWQDLPAYRVKVAQGVDTRLPQSAPRASMGPQDSSMASFDFSGVVDVSITYNKGNIESARVRPLSYDITPAVKKDTITFSLSQSR